MPLVTDRPDFATSRRPPQPTPLAVRLAVALLPSRFRGQYGEEMLDLYRRRRSHAAADGRWAVIRLYVRTVLDLLRTAVAERRGSSFLPTRVPPSSLPPHDGDDFVMSLLYDLRHALRGVARRFSYSAVVVVTLALGLGASTAVFTVVNGVLLAPLPFEEPDRLLRVYGRFDPQSGMDIPKFNLADPEYLDYAAAAEAVEAVAGFTVGGQTVTGNDGTAERVPAAFVTASFFPLLRVEAERGRAFTADEDLPGANQVALLSHGYWQERFGGGDVLGREIVINGSPRTILGVMPEGFSFPTARTRLWLPLAIDAANPGDRQSHYFDAIARLASGVDKVEADSEMATLMATWKAEYPDIHTGHYLFLTPLHEDMVGGIRPALLTLLAAAGFVLLIVCANVASIVLARSQDRSRDMAVRSALGASRSRLARLVVFEALVLSLLGGALGVLLARIGVSALMTLQMGGVPRAENVTIDFTVFTFALVATLLTAFLFSAVPALHTASVAPRQRLVEGSAQTGESSRRALFRQSLVATEVAMSFILVLGAGLMIRSFGQLIAVDPGIRPDGLLVVGLQLPRNDYPEPLRVIGFQEELAERARALPAVKSASVSTYVPFFYGNGVWDFEIDGRQEMVDAEMAFNAAFAAIDQHYFDVTRARILRGRGFLPGDTADSELVAVVNEEFVRRFLADVDPIGQRLRVDQREPGFPWSRIVGVVENDRGNGLANDPLPTYYFATAQTPINVGGRFGFCALVVRTPGDPDALIGPLRSLVADMDPNMPLIAPQSMVDAISDSVAQPRFTALLLSLFAGVALALGGCGIYGILAYSVAQRTREIGIRKALGAQPGQVIRTVARQAMVPVTAGLAIGSVASAYLGRLLSGLLFGVTPTNGGAYAAVAATMVLVAVLACLAPCLRALRMNTVRALRVD